MITLQSKMTSHELAECIGVKNQTVNRWVREQKWRTEKIPGVKGGRARLIHIDPRVREYLANVPALRHRTIPFQASDSTLEYGAVDLDNPLQQISQILQSLTPDELQRVLGFLRRQGTQVFLDRLKIVSDES